MPESDAKEETAESIAEKKEQVYHYSKEINFPQKWMKKEVRIDWLDVFPIGATQTVRGQTKRKRKTWKIFKIKNEGKRWSWKVQRQGKIQNKSIFLIKQHYSLFSTNSRPLRPPVMRKMSALMRRMTLLDPKKRKSRRIPSRVCLFVKILKNYTF